VISLVYDKGKVADDNGSKEHVKSRIADHAYYEPAQWASFGSELQIIFVFFRVFCQSRKCDGSKFFDRISGVAGIAVLFGVVDIVAGLHQVPTFLGCGAQWWAGSSAKSAQN